MAEGEVAKYWKTAGIGGVVVVIIGAVITAVLSSGGNTPSGVGQDSPGTAGIGQQSTYSAAATPPSTTGPADQSVGPAIPPTTDAPTTAAVASWYTVTLGTVLGGQPDNGQAVVGGKLFSYLYEVDPNNLENGASASTCRSVTVTVGVSDSKADTVTGTGTLSVITENGTATMSFKVRTLTTKTFALGPSGAFKFSTTLNSYYAAVLWNGTLSCSTPNGRSQP
jgi:hypothetical protein